jgi:peptide/nickel transport system substrate-binding protein
LTNEQWIYRKTTGQFDALIDWDACGSINEPWASLDRYHSRWVRPLGEPVTNYNNQVRWSNAEYSALVDQMAPLPLGDPQVDELFVQAMRIWAKELPFIPLVQEKQLISFDTTYWTNWPTASNNYVHPPSWWQSTHIIVHSLEPAELE